MDPPCIWQNSLHGTPKTGNERPGLWLMTEMAQLPRRRPGYGLKPSGILLELDLEPDLMVVDRQKIKGAKKPPGSNKPPGILQKNVAK